MGRSALFTDPMAFWPAAKISERMRRVYRIGWTASSPGLGLSMGRKILLHCHFRHVVPCPTRGWSS